MEEGKWIHTVIEIRVKNRQCAGVKIKFDFLKDEA
jgi:hypothetical protein